jgi:hypothetical protein
MGGTNRHKWDPAHRRRHRACAISFTQIQRTICAQNPPLCSGESLQRTLSRPVSQLSQRTRMSTNNRAGQSIPTSTKGQPNPELKHNTTQRSIATRKSFMMAKISPKKQSRSKCSLPEKNLIQLRASTMRRYILSSIMLKYISLGGSARGICLESWVTITAQWGLALEILPTNTKLQQAGKAQHDRGKQAFLLSCHLHKTTLNDLDSGTRMRCSCDSKIRYFLSHGR